MGYRDFSKKDIKWIIKFQKVMKTAPKELFMFVGGSGSITIYSERRMDGSNGTGVNQEVPNHSISTPMDCDGGDW
jgi:hypothetical protein